MTELPFDFVNLMANFATGLVGYFLMIAAWRDPFAATDAPTSEHVIQNIFMAFCSLMAFGGTIGFAHAAVNIVTAITKL